ncbi:MAG TPA: hypothetical protein VFQ39_05000 [Longimicrobium sp.]|nr:hypothetical protein [Longimicrobium sp.]
MTVHTRPLAEVTDRAIRLLSREMGPADTMRFLNQFVTGSGNYTEERKALFDDMTLEQLLAEAKRRADT